NFVQCSQVGSYTYDRHAEDMVALTAPYWQALDADRHTTSTPAAWHVGQDGTLIVAPANYWPNGNEADCTCPGDGGVRISGDQITGARLRYSPGISCEVC